MSDCASVFPTAFSASAELVESDRQEWLAAAAILGAVAMPEGAVWLSAAHDDFAAVLARHAAVGTKVVVLAGRAQTALRRAAFQAGAYEFLTTGPIDPVELAARLRLLQSGSSLPEGIALDDCQLRVGGALHVLSAREAGIVALLIAACRDQQSAADDAVADTPGLSADASAIAEARGLTPADVSAALITALSTMVWAWRRKP